MQEALWKIGAFKGLKDRHGREVTLETAIDGINGEMTQQALANAKKMGYTQKDATTFVKPNSSKSNNLARTREMIHSARTGGMSSESQIKAFLMNAGVPQDQVRALKLPEDAVDRNGNMTDQCAAYVNGVLKRNGIKSWGNSYHINSQFKSFINGYDNIDKPTILNAANITKFHKQAADSLASKLDTLAMNPNNVYTANMYYTDRAGNPSSHTVDFYNEAVDNNDKQYATHIGLIYHDKDRNQWRVTHNIGYDKKGHLYNEPLSEDLGSRAKHGYGITSIADAGSLKHWWEF